MKRIFIPLKDFEIYDYMHVKQPDGSFEVDEEKDGQSTQQHIDSIEYMKDVLVRGQKMRPVLVVDNEDGTFTRLDGFKRCIAHKELGRAYIEAFVCSRAEFIENKRVEYDGAYMYCTKGGQPKEDYTLFEGAEREDFNYGETIFLFKGRPEGLRVEVAETIHVHWGQYGRNRLDLGRRDFLALASAVSSIPDLWVK